MPVECHFSLRTEIWDDRANSKAKQGFCLGELQEELFEQMLRPYTESGFWSSMASSHYMGYHFLSSTLKEASKDQIFGQSNDTTKGRGIKLA